MGFSVVTFIHGSPFFAWLCIMLSLTLGRTGDRDGGGGGGGECCHSPLRFF